MGRTRIELLTSGDIDMFDDVSTPLTFAIADIRTPDKRDSHFSKTIKVPATKGNNIRFGNIFDVNLKDGRYNPNRKAPCTLYIDDVPQLNGFLQILNIELNDKNDYVYNCTIRGNVNNIFQTLGDDLLTDLDFSAYDHVLSRTNQKATYSNTYVDGYCYPLIDYGFNSLYNEWKVEHILPAIFVRTYIDKIFSNAGFTYSSTFFDSTIFKKLIIPCTGDSFKYSNAQIEARLFEAGRSGTQTIPNSGYSYPVNNPTAIAGLPQLSFNTDVSDPANAFNTATGKWSPPATGYYNIDADCALNSSGTISGLGSGILSLIGIRKFDTVGLNYTLIDTHYAAVNGVSTVFKVDAANVYLKTTDQIDIVIFPWSGQYFNPSAQWQFNASGSRFYNSVSNIGLQAGDTVTMNNTVPTKTKQKDFLLDIIRMFNLYVEVDKDNSNKLLIETRDDFYTSGTTIDWTYKLDNSQPLELTPMGDLDFKKFNYKYKDDKDYYNAKYLTTNSIGYGNRIFEVDNDFLKSENNLSVMFSPTPLAATTGDDKIIPKIYEIDSNNVAKFKPFNIRILYNGGQKTTNNPFQYIDGLVSTTTETTYLYAGHLDSPTAPTFDLSFGVPIELYYNANIYTNANLFNKYHKRFIEEITDADSKVVTGYFYLTPRDIAELDFRNNFYFEGQYFRLNKIYDYNPIGEQVTKCEFIKIKEGRSFTSSTGIVFGGFTTGELIDNDLTDVKPTIATTENIGSNRNLIVYGNNNVLGGSLYNSYINGSYNYVHGGNNINLLGSSGNTIYDGLENVTLINTSGTTVSSSNTLYVNGYEITSGTIAALSAEWSSVPFNASDYTCSVGSWTVDAGDVFENKYILIGKTLTWSCTINFSGTSNDNTYYRIVIPNGYTAKGVNSCPVSIVASLSTVYSDAYAYTATGNNYITIGRYLSSTMVASAGNVAVIFTITFEIQ